MPHSYCLLLVAGLALPAAAQPVTPPPPAPADTLRRSFRGALPDSLAAAPAPAGTFWLQGQAQPIRPFATLQDQLRTVAGVQVTPYDGSPGSGSVVRIRGASAVAGQGQPLYVVDGLPALNDELTPDQALGLGQATMVYGQFNSSYYQSSVADQHAEVGSNPLLLLPPEAIESIEVLAGPAAVARYGPLGANGVVSIRTRRAAAGQPLRVQYTAYAGVQRVRRPYDLLPASEFGAILNERFPASTLPPTYSPAQLAQLGAGTDWQAETYRTAGLQQHQLGLEGGRAGTTFRVGADYRQQNGVLPGDELSRYGLRLALDQRVGSRLHLHGTAALGQTDQRRPFTTGDAGATRAALAAPPIAPVRTAQGIYAQAYPTPSGQAVGFNNPLAVAENTYRTPRTRRLLAQLGADYQLAPHLTVEAAANFQRTLLDAESLVAFYLPTGKPTSPRVHADHTYQTSQWGGQVALRYQRQLGPHHRLGAELNYQYQGVSINRRTDTFSLDIYSTATYPLSYFTIGPAELRLHRPWAGLTYALDSTLDVQAGLSYGHYKGDEATRYYPSAQVRWHPRPSQPDLSLWLGAARSSTLGLGFGLFGPLLLSTPPPYPSPNVYLRQSALYNDQLEAGLHLGRRGGHLTGQVVAYQRTTCHALLQQDVAVPSNTGYAYLTLSGEGTIRNQGLELTLAATWQAGRLHGTSRLAASANRNRLQDDASLFRLSPAFDNQPVGAFYGYQQDGLTATGNLRFRDPNGNGYRDQADQAVLGNGIPAQLASLSQQLRLGRLALDAQVDGLFGYQVLNHQLAFLDVPTGFTNNAPTVRDRWTPTHQQTTVPAAIAQLSTYLPLSDRLLENGSNVRLSSLTLTYRLRQTATQDLSVWVGGQNLLVLTAYRGYDPNVSSGGSAAYLAGQDYGAVPIPRTWLLGVRASL